MDIYGVDKPQDSCVCVCVCVCIYAPLLLCPTENHCVHTDLVEVTVTQLDAWDLCHNRSSNYIWMLVFAYIFRVALDFVLRIFACRYMNDASGMFLV